MTQNFDHAADSRYYYSIWGHNYSYNGSFTTSSGIADITGRVHLVTLGSFPARPVPSATRWAPSSMSSATTWGSSTAAPTAATTSRIT